VASQYITFMIVFTLGLSMVIVTNEMFTTMSDRFQLNIAEFEMDEVLDEIQTQIYENLLLTSNFNQIIEQRLDLPENLAQRFGYTIGISNSTSNEVSINGVTFNDRINQTKTFSIGSTYLINTQGEFSSTSPELILRIEKVGNEILIQIS